jgi:NADH-quinone oxidoreductase subunit D
MTILNDPVSAKLGNRQQLSYIASQAADARLNVELETEGMTLNIGPQHPATHGTLRIIARLDGEQVVWAEPSCGYMHRGYEKLTEVRTFPQVTTLVNRIDWLGSFANEVPFILAAEKLMGVEAPDRAQWIRTILFELSRIANVSLFLGDLGVQLGAITPVFLAFRDREYVLNLIESATGGRFHPNFDRIGGLKDDLPAGWIDETKVVMKKLRNFCDEIETLLFGNEIFQSRTRGIGVIPRDVALQYGLSGANLRASGVDWDLRRDQDIALAYNKVDFKVWTHPDGDSFARCWIRLQETREATLIVDKLLDGIPSGPVMAKVPKIIKVPEGEAWVSTENPLGEMGYYVVSRGDLGPFRVKIRSASFNNISITPWLLRGVYVPDIITILASLSRSRTGVSRFCACSVGWWPCCCLRAPSCTCSCSR